MYVIYEKRIDIYIINLGNGIWSKFDTDLFTHRSEIQRSVHFRTLNYSYKRA